MPVESESENVEKETASFEGESVIVENERFTVETEGFRKRRHELGGRERPAGLCEWRDRSHKRWMIRMNGVAERADGMMVCADVGAAFVNGLTVCADVRRDVRRAAAVKRLRRLLDRFAFRCHPELMLPIVKPRYPRVAWIASVFAGVVALVVAKPIISSIATSVSDSAGRDAGGIVAGLLSAITVAAPMIPVVIWHRRVKRAHLSRVRAGELCARCWAQFEPSDNRHEDHGELLCDGCRKVLRL